VTRGRIMADRIGVIGTGYVGLVTAAAFARLGRRVVCHDVDESRLADLAAGRVPFYEPGLQETLTEAAGLIELTADPARLFRAAEVAFVCVDTPPRPDGAADLSRVEAVVDSIPAWAHPLIVMKSTVPVGTGARITALLELRGRGDVGYVSNPEFLREGSAMRDVFNPDRIVIGGFAKADVERVAALYQPTTAPIIRTDTNSAELIKYASNAFLATKISFINEIANLCEAVGAHVDTVADGMGLDQRIGRGFLNAGIGYGGSCFAKDISALQSVATAHGRPLRIVAATQEVNALQPRLVVERIRDRLGRVAGARVALLGLSFKPHTSDVRSAVSAQLARALREAGAELVAHDPVVDATTAQRLTGGAVAASLHEALRGADAAVIVTEWPEYRSLLDSGVAASMRTALLIDGRNLLDADEASAAGYVYDGIGRPSAASPARPARIRIAA
jgi:UDPglucose 6-dehydrogenase